MTRPNPAPTSLLAIDPGTPHQGAYFRDGILERCGVPAFPHADVFKHQQLGTILQLGTAMVNAPGLVVVCEVPQIYKQAKGDQNDLIDLALNIGTDLRGPAIASGATWYQYRPAQWKGQVKKWSHHLAVLGLLRVPEIEVLEHALGRGLGDIQRYVQAACDAHARRGKPRYDREDHNTLDAVAMGLWALGRLA